MAFKAIQFTLTSRNGSNLSQSTHYNRQQTIMNMKLTIFALTLLICAAHAASTSSPPPPFTRNGLQCMKISDAGV